MRLAVAALLAVTGGTAQADGFFYQQSYGISSARGDAAPLMGESLQLRLAMGWRFGAVQVGPWLSSHMAWNREDAYFGYIGGDPEMGDSDLETLGVDVKYNAAITEHLSAYVRGGPRHANGLGALEGWQGIGVGAATGVALTGKVRALCFVAIPLCFAGKGPKITATLFIDYNVEWYGMSGENMPNLSLPLLGTSIGFGAGSFF